MQRYRDGAAADGAALRAAAALRRRAARAIPPHRRPHLGRTACGDLPHEYSLVNLASQWSSRLAVLEMVVRHERRSGVDLAWTSGWSSWRA